MRAIIMAAGIGTRISRHVDRPKCLLEIEGTPILARTVEMLKANDIEPVVVTGYQHGQIERLAKEHGIDTVFNPFYRVTNSLGTLWFARDYIRPDEDLFLMNADVFWGQDILDILLAETKPAVMLADSSLSRLEQGDYFFGTENNKIVKYGKDLAREIRTHEYVGIGRIRPSFQTVFLDMMTYLIESEQYNCWWEDVLYRCSADHDVYIRDIAGHFWAEIDYIEDYERIMNYVFSQQGKKEDA